MSEITCPNCGRSNAESRRYCAFCGVNLGDAAPKDAQGRPQYEQLKRLSIEQRIKRLLRRSS